MSSNSRPESRNCCAGGVVDLWDLCLARKPQSATSTAGYTPLQTATKAILPPDGPFQEPRDASAAYQVQRGVQKHIWAMGAMTWMAGAPFLRMAAVGTTCNDGLMTPYYGVPAAAIAVKSWLEYAAINHMKQQGDDHKVIKAGVALWESPVSRMDSANLLMFLGGTLSFDFFTDNSQIVQIWMCDRASNSTFHDQYLRSYAGELDFV